MNTLSDPKAPIKATCHCGAITITAPGHPDEAINECQCTICRRYAAAWAYYNTKDVRIEVKEGASLGKYSRGDKQLTFDWCTRCGCLMNWWPLKVPEGGKDGVKMGLNSRMMEPDAIRGVNWIQDYETLFVAVPEGEV